MVNISCVHFNVTFVSLMFSLRCYFPIHLYSEQIHCMQTPDCAVCRIVPEFLPQTVPLFATSVSPQCSFPSTCLCRFVLLVECHNKQSLHIWQIWDSSVDIFMGWVAGARLSVGAREFPVLRSVNTGLGPTRSPI